MKSFLLLSVITGAHLFAFGYLSYRANQIAGLTKGGISPSEVLEGLFPGGLLTLLLVLVFLIASTTWAYFFWRKRKS